MAGTDAPGAPGPEPPPARLLIGAIVADPAAWAVAERELAAAFGPLDPCVLALPFDHTAYYRGEMGDRLLRVFRVHREPVPQDALGAIKLRTAALEAALADRGGERPRRRVNLDPGLIGLHGVVLASTKGYAHRVYLGRGIHAEVTLVWRGGAFRPVAWTYPDYRGDEALSFFAAARRGLLARLRAGQASRAAHAEAACC